MFVQLLVALLLCLGVECFPDGAPVDACVKNRPNQPNHGQHRTQPLSSLPYRIIATSSVYSPNSAITGNVSSLSNILVRLCINVEQITHRVIY